MASLLFREPRMFPKGWGNLSIPLGLVEELTSDIDQGNFESGLTLKEESIIWNDYSLNDKMDEEDSIVAKQGRFLSPIAHVLPDEAKYCSFVFVEPVVSACRRQQQESETSKYHNNERCKNNNNKNRNNNNDSPHPATIVIILPGTGEADISSRLQIAQTLAEKHGYASVLPDVMFLGDRCPPDQESFFVQNVEHMALQNVGSMQEAAALALFFLQGEQNNRVCLTGFSFGAAVAVCAATRCLIAGGGDSTLGQRLACAPYVGCSSPAVLVDGAFRRMVIWDKLQEEMDENESKNENGAWEQTSNCYGRGSKRRTRRATLCEIRSLSDRLRNYLDQFSLPVLVERNLKREQELGRENRLAAVCVAVMRRDRIICRKRSQDLIRDLQKGVVSSSSDAFSLYHLPGGHVSAALTRFQHHVMLIEEAAEKLNRQTARHELTIEQGKNS
eukprot:CAMPEP_0118710724 /NCGR_PEP_ID=MMETSP0800-20121206/23586_1 /TAXON_ID=210618 ORGANISM="Striatella unipunctata, Strain CCMP2910" /NCGR_SAMPLE_ID=MMETSP0800 /ASSEMBLY_ACC=CAM_ASM_000638 /LENGTH=444 /DNA_ID=CAMNT_0006615029 /DNA_START=96 /DNA_END=1430 /DNA_ORIENTATION=-